MKRLEGQVAIVTGGARGIGEGICEVFCREGATVLLWDILDGTETAEKISKSGGNLTCRGTYKQGGGPTNDGWAGENTPLKYHDHNNSPPPPVKPATSLCIKPP